MGMMMSFMGGKGDGVSSQMFNLATATLYDQFFGNDIKDFEAFHEAILEMFNAINMGLPGKHYDAPQRKEVVAFFNEWKEVQGEEAKKKVFTDFMKHNVNLNKVDEAMVVTGIVAPPAAMVVKRTGQSVPKFSVMKAIPDAVFVPSATILALIAVKISKNMFMKKLPSTS